jgi:glycerol-3-phosphate acyltransferase PlsY
VATWIIIVAFLRYSSLAALVAAAFAPFFTALLFGLNATFAVVLAMAALLVWRHRENIARLIAGTESRIGAKKAS